jgi:CRISPR system Cascade subunit CasE
MRVLGYSSHPADEMHEQAQTFADPLVLAAGNLSRPIPGKTMPSTWKKGLRMGFEVLACPVTRKDSQEKDVYLRRVDQATDGQATLDRETVYGEWLARQLADSAELNQRHLQGFQLIRQFRRGRRATPNGKRNARGITRPQALIQGELTIIDGEAFGTGLARGIGRHRAFGYGMLLLRPAS